MSVGPVHADERPFKLRAWPLPLAFDRLHGGADEADYFFLAAPQ